MRYSQRASLFLWSRAPHGPWPLSAVDDAPRRDFVSAAALKYGRDDAYARVVVAHARISTVKNFLVLL